MTKNKKAGDNKIVDRLTITISNLNDLRDNYSGARLKVITLLQHFVRLLGDCTS
jgi:hypothetical protein